MRQSATAIGSAVGFRRYFINTSWLSAERAARLVISFFVGVYLARYLGVEEYGLYSYVLALCALIGAVAKLGLDELLVREVIVGSGEHKRYLGTVFWLQSAAVLLVLAGAAIFVLRNPSGTSILLLVALAGMLFQPFQAVDAYFKSQVLAKYSSIASAVQLVISSALKLGLIAMEADLIYFAAVIALDWAWIAFALSVLYFLKGFPNFFQYFDWAVARGLLARSWQLVFAGLAITLYMRIDQIMLKEIVGAAETGLYSAAVRISEAINVVPVVVGASLFPALVTATAAPQKLRDRTLVLFEVFFLGALGAVGLVTLIASPLIITLYGPEFAGADRILIVHVWSVPFVFLGVASARWLLAKNLGFYLMLRALVGALLNVGLNLLLIPRYGGVGAAIATVCSFACAAVVMNALSVKTRECFVLQVRAICLPGSASLREFRLARSRNSVEGAN